MNNNRYNKLEVFISIIFLIAVAGPASVFSASPISLSLGNGARVELYSPEALEEHIDYGANGFATLSLPSGEVYRLITDVNDPSIANKGDGEFHPFNIELVVEALNGINLDGQKLDIQARIYILPYPVSGYLCSFASERDIFLSPGVYEIDVSVTSYIVTHEFGHIFQHRYLPLDDEDGWEEYLSLRGVAAAYSSELTEHSERPVEAFAEDFRYLFGDEEARYSDSIENEALIPPDQVPGLREFFVSLVQGVDLAERTSKVPFEVYNYPNPFNPATTIVAEFEDYDASITDRAVLQIFSVDGRLVKRITSGKIDGNRVRFAWDGTNEKGTRVTSGTYFYSVSSGRERSVGKMLLIR